MSETRPVGPADAAVLAALHGTCFPDEPWDEKAIGEVLGMPGAFGFLACGRGTVPLGFLLALDLGAECEVLALGVLPAARRHGHARRLLARFFDILAARPAHLDVAEDNAAALALYRSAGFRAVGRRPEYYRRRDGTAVTALLLLRAGKS